MMLFPDDEAWKDSKLHKQPTALTRKDYDLFTINAQVETEWRAAFPGVGVDMANGKQVY